MAIDAKSEIKVSVAELYIDDYIMESEVTPLHYFNNKTIMLECYNLDNAMYRYTKEKGSGNIASINTPLEKIWKSAENIIVSKWDVLTAALKTQDNSVDGIKLSIFKGESSLASGECITFVLTDALTCDPIVTNTYRDYSIEATGAKAIIKDNDIILVSMLFTELDYA